MLYSVSEGKTLDDVPTDVGLVTMGINPSARSLHEGHYLTMYQAFKAMHRMPWTRGQIFVDDREFDFRKELDREGRFRRLPDPDVTREIGERIRSFADAIADQLGDDTLSRRLTVQPMSAYMREHAPDGVTRGFMLYDYIRRFRTHIEAIYSFSRMEDGQRSAVRTACPRCRSSERCNTHQLERETRMHAICVNNVCPDRRMMYTVDPEKGDDNWTMHYAIDPVRDGFIARELNNGVLHVFGGDYGVPWGVGGTPKAERMDILLQESRMSDPPVHHYVGPMLTRDGCKISKSDGCSSEPLGAEELERLLARASAEPRLSLSGCVDTTKPPAPEETGGVRPVAWQDETIERLKAV